MKSIRMKRFIAVILVFTLALISPMQFVRSNAAEKTVKYVKEFKLFIKKDGTKADADDWCKRQSDGDWHAVEGDLNDGTEGAFSDKIGVFLCYCTTENEKEAVRDIAVMNEKGNYSESNYQILLEKMKEEYRDLVNDLKTQIKNYQENLRKKVETAVEAHDLLNGYKEDDSGKLLGDLLAELNPDEEKDEEQLANILLQANGQVVLFIQQELSLASESGNRTWLDRMEKLGSYDEFYSRIKKAHNGDDSLAKSFMDKKYKEGAVEIADAWEELRQKFEDIKKYEERCGIEAMSEEQLKEWNDNNYTTPEGIDYVQKVACADNLKMYKYEDKSLLDFFMQDKLEISGDNLRKLYPMVSCLQPGQQAGLHSTVNLYSLIVQAFSATLLNDYNKGKLEEVKDAVGTENTKEVEESRKLVEENIDQQKKNEPESVYKGVDREIFKGGVAVTSDTLDYSNSSEVKWTDRFVENNSEIQCLFVGGFCCGGFAAIALHIAYDTVLDKAAEMTIRRFDNGELTYHFSRKVERVLNKLHGYEDPFFQLRTIVREGSEKQQAIAKQAMKELEKATISDSAGTKIMYALSRGVTILLILVAVADVIMNVVALIDYYNRDHLPIPHHIVDLTAYKNEETSYVIYKSVKDNNGKQGDLNGGSSKQWLALYQTYDERAGAPIVAPGAGYSGYEIKVYYGNSKRGSYGTTPLHMFGTPNVEQNLTNADGEKGWSYNDKRRGTYLYYSHYDGSLINKEDEKTEETVSDEPSVTAEPSADTATDETAVSGAAADIGTSTGAGTTALIGALCGVAGIGIGFAVGATRRRKKVKDSV
ncbi:MAG: hypothetical protein IKQ97_05745 [Eubacterium sp.]|nr:hypothetical protein [Eubacterium sp.]